MVEKSSDYEYLATYADDLMAWSQGIVRVIKSLESIYLLKDVGTPDYSLGGVLGEHWKWQVLGLSLSARTYTQNVTPKLENCIGKVFETIKTPMSEGYHPELGDSSLCNNEDSVMYRSIIGCCF